MRTGDFQFFPQVFRDVIREPKALVEEFGIEVCDIRGAVEPVGPGLLLMQVDTDPSEIDRAVRSHPIWGPQLETGTIDGVEFYDWADGLGGDFEGRSPVRPVADAGQLAIVDDVVIRTGDREALEDHFGNEERNLLGRRDVQPVLGMLEQAGAFSIVLTEEFYSSDVSNILGTASAGLDEDALTGPLVWWALLGLGAAVDDEGEPILIVVFAHASTADAELNEARFVSLIDSAISHRINKPWSEILSLGDIRVQDDYVVARLHAREGRSPFGVAVSALFSQDTLFMVNDS